MAFTITVDDEAMLRQLTELQNNFTNLPQTMSETFIEWQREDMNRKFPKVEGSGTTVSTMIYPRSRLQRRKGKSGGKATRRRSRIAASRPGSHRPILRQELSDQLEQRMSDMLKEAAQWQ